MSNDEKNRILNELTKELYPEDFERSTLDASAPLEIETKSFIKLIRFCNQNETHFSIFWSHLISGIRKHKGYSIYDVLGTRQRWRIDGQPYPMGDRLQPPLRFLPQ